MERGDGGDAGGRGCLRAENIFPLSGILFLGEGGGREGFPRKLRDAQKSLQIIFESSLGDSVGSWLETWEGEAAWRERLLLRDVMGHGCRCL